MEVRFSGKKHKQNVTSPLQLGVPLNVGGRVYEAKYSEVLVQEINILP